MNTPSAPKLPTPANTKTPIQRVVLTGFMGSGKSTCGPLLAAQLNWRFLDLDNFIESRQQLSIAQIFSTHGEAHFRSLEEQAIEALLRETSLVLALGGGAIESPLTRSRLQLPGTLLVHLEASLSTAIERCSGTDATRPILADRPNLEARYLRRLPLYQTAHLNLNVDSIKPNQAAERIYSTIQLLS